MDTIGLDDLSFGKAAVEKRQFVEAYLRCFFGKPLCAVHIICWRHGQVQVSLPQWFLRQGFQYVHQAAFVGRCAYFSAVEASFAVGQGHFVACFEAEHTYGVCCFFFGQFGPCLLVWRIKYVPQSWWFYFFIWFFMSRRLAAVSFSFASVGFF